MTPQDRTFIVGVLADELDLLTPGCPSTRSANEALAAEFIEEHHELVMKAVAHARQSGGGLNPWGLDRELTGPFIRHCQNRIRPRTREARD